MYMLEGGGGGDLVSQKDSWYVVSIGQEHFAIQVSFPPLHRFKGGGPCHIEHNESPSGLFEVHLGIRGSGQQCYLLSSLLTMNMCVCVVNVCAYVYVQVCACV